MMVGISLLDTTKEEKLSEFHDLLDDYAHSVYGFITGEDPTKFVSQWDRLSMTRSKVVSFVEGLINT